MSITPPENYLYGTVVGRFLSTIVDSADVDRYPDVTAATGSITFTPKVSYYKNLTLPATFITIPVVGTLDSSGYLRDSQNQLGVVLTDPSSPGISPAGWTYSVSMTISGKTLPSFDITVVGGETIDLTLVMPAAVSAGTVTIVSEAARIAAEDARDEAVAAAALLSGTGLEDAIEAYLIANPPAGGVPNGGTALQLLHKNSTTDGDVSWFTLTKSDIGLGSVDNVSAASLRDRSTHTGTQAQSTVTNLTTDLAAKAPLASPALTGSPTAPTPTAGDNDTSIATTAFVTGAVATSAATKANTSHTHAQSDITSLTTDMAAKAPLASPAFTGNPTAPTPTAGDSDTSIATTAFVTGGVATAVATKSDKTASAGFRVKSGSTDIGAGPGWPLRPTGYAMVFAVGADPSPTDSLAGDGRMIPAT